MPKPYFIITIDTEGDNLWARPELVTTENVKFIPRFQALAEKYGLKSTYLTNFEMANSKKFQEFGLKVVREGTGEIGMHLHAWISTHGCQRMDIHTWISIHGSVHGYPCMDIHDINQQ